MTDCPSIFERGPFGIVGDGNRNPVVVAGTGIGVMRRHRVVAITQLAAVAAIHEIVHVPLMHLADDGLAHAGVDPLTLAGAIAMTQRGECMENDRGGDA